jgi:DNA helicase-2/ATP-dependent DNA helicase PcrA
VCTPFWCPDAGSQNVAAATASKACVTSPISAPSPKQQALISWIRTGQGDALVSAVAGSGKTTSLKHAAKTIRSMDKSGASQARVMFLAYNRTIANELGEKLKELDLPGMETSTLHGLGRKIVQARVGKLEEGSGKYFAIARDVLQDANVPLTSFEHSWKEAISPLLEFVRLTSPNESQWRNVQHVQAVAREYDLELPEELRDATFAAVPEILDRGRAMVMLTQSGARSPTTRPPRGTPIDFADMIWLPTQMAVSSIQFDWILVDEAQDLSAAQRALVMSCRAEGGRVIFVGDASQAIYGFTGADNESINAIRNPRQGTPPTELPLDVCYRCPTRHIALAQRIEPTIQPAAGAAPGELVILADDLDAVAVVEPGDLVIARTTRALLEIAAVIRKKRPDLPLVFVGPSTERDLRKIVAAVRMRAGTPMEHFEHGLADHEREETARLELAIQALRRTLLPNDTPPDASTDGLTEDDLDGPLKLGNDDPGALQDKVIALAEHVRTLRTILARRPQWTAAEFDNAVREWIPDGVNAVRLSSIHRAKGLEADHVVLIDAAKLPLPRVTKPADAKQENHLLYVALTRARKKLTICGTLAHKAFADLAPDAIATQQMPPLRLERVSREPHGDLALATPRRPPQPQSKPAVRATAISPTPAVHLSPIGKRVGAFRDALTPTPVTGTPERASTGSLVQRGLRQRRRAGVLIAVLAGILAVGTIWRPRILSVLGPAETSGDDSLLRADLALARGRLASGSQGAAGHSKTQRPRHDARTRSQALPGPTDDGAIRQNILSAIRRAEARIARDDLATMREDLLPAANLTDSLIEANGRTTALDSLSRRLVSLQQVVSKRCEEERARRLAAGDRSISPCL